VSQAAPTVQRSWCLVVLGFVVMAAGCPGQSSNPQADRSAKHRELPGEPLVPSVIGDAWPAAEKELGHRHLQPKAAFLGFPLRARPCAGHPGESEIVRQRPDPGTRLTLHSKVQVQVGCPPLSDLEECAPNELYLASFGVDAIGAGSPNSVFAGIKHVYGGACRLDGRFTVSLQRRDGTLATEIAGNPATVPIAHRLGVGETLNLSWGWSGCPHGEFVATLAGPDGLNDRADAPPYCQEGSIQTRLYPAESQYPAYNSNRAYRTALRALRP
jgi:hypothetical protein